MTIYGLTIENQNLIIEKAKFKADGVFKFRGVVYRVKNHKVTHFADNFKILQGYGAFNVVVGRIDCSPLSFQSEAVKVLRNIKD